MPRMFPTASVRVLESNHKVRETRKIKVDGLVIKCQVYVGNGNAFCCRATTVPLGSDRQNQWVDWPATIEEEEVECL